MTFFDDLSDGGTKTRGRKLIKQGRVFGQTNMDPPVLGRKRRGKTAGGWDGTTIWR